MNNKQLMLMAAGAFLLLSMTAKKPAVASVPGRNPATVAPTNAISDLWSRMGLRDLAAAVTRPAPASASTVQNRTGGLAGSSAGLFGGSDWWRPLDLTTGRAITAETDRAGIGFDPTSSGPGLSIDPSRYGTGVRFGDGDLNAWLNLSQDGGGNWTTTGSSGGGSGLRSSGMTGLRIGEAPAPGTDFSMMSAADSFFTSANDLFYMA